MRKYTDGLLDNRKILKSLNICTGQTILDAGCGNGYMARIFSGMVGNKGKIYAIDKDRRMIDCFEKGFETNNIEAFVADISKPTGLKDSSMDIVYLSTVFHIFTEAQIDGFVKEVKRILKPQGLLAIVNIKKEETPFGPPMEIRSSPEELRQKLPFAPEDLVEAGEHFYMQIFKKES